MKVFKITKYHIPYDSRSMDALCGKDRHIRIIKDRIISSISHHRIIEYNENMDMCKICQRVNFKRIVYKLKGKGID